MWKNIKDKIISALTTIALTAILALVLFLGIKYSSRLKNEIELKAASANNPAQSQSTSGNQFSNLPTIDFNKQNFSAQDIQQISQALGTDASTTQKQIDGIKNLQTDLLPALIKDDPQVAALFSFPVIKDSSIKTTAASDGGEKYLSQVSDLLKKDLPENNLPPQIIVLLKVAQKYPDIVPELNLSTVNLNDPTVNKILDLNIYITSYQKLLSDIKNVPVPKSWIELQKQQILTIQATIASFEALQKYPDDKLAAAMSLQTVQTASTNLNSVIEEFKNSLTTSWQAR